MAMFSVNNDDKSRYTLQGVLHSSGIFLYVGKAEPAIEMEFLQADQHCRQLPCVGSEIDRARHAQRIAWRKESDE
jgi:hypothetical protein